MGSRITDPRDMEAGIHVTAVPDFFNDLRPDELGTTHTINPSLTTGVRGDFKSFINLHKSNRESVGVIVSVRSEYSVVQPVPSVGNTLIPDFPGVSIGTPQVGSPLVARLTWGVGGGRNTVEFDIPSPRFMANLQPPNPACQPTNDAGNGVQVYVFGSGFDLLVRNDGALAPATAPFALSPVGVGAASAIGTRFPAKVVAFIGPGHSRGGSPLRRTIWVSDPNFPLAATASVAITIPAFARRVYILREFPEAQPLLLLFRDSNNITNHFVNVPVNFMGPIEIMPNDDNMVLTNNGAFAISNLKAMFDVSPI